MDTAEFSIDVARQRLDLGGDRQEEKEKEEEGQKGGERERGEERGRGNGREGKEEGKEGVEGRVGREVGKKGRGGGERKGRRRGREREKDGGISGVRTDMQMWKGCRSPLFSERLSQLLTTTISCGECYHFTQ